MRRCDCCGQIIAPELVIKKLGVSRQSLVRVRGTVKQLLYAAIRKRPHTAEELRDLVWADDPHASVSRVYIHIHRLNRLLLRHGLAVRGGDKYRLVNLEDRERDRPSA
jgi:hypothetical protein